MNDTMYEYAEVTTMQAVARLHTHLVSARTLAGDHTLGQCSRQLVECARLADKLGETALHDDIVKFHKGAFLSDGEQSFASLQAGIDVLLARYDDCLRESDTAYTPSVEAM